MLRWMLFFLLILTAILLFVTWVMGVPIPGLDNLQPPDSPFSP
jgi:hypothetical protein